MQNHFHDELKKLNDKLLQMGLLVEVSIDNAIQAFMQGKEDFAQRVLNNEALINQLEMEIDDQGHHFIALQAPVAVDLRVITGILKINTALERMGDHAVNIAERAIQGVQLSPLPVKTHLPDMAESVEKILRNALDAFIQRDVLLAREVLKQDDEVDTYQDHLYGQLALLMEREPHRVRTGLNYYMVVTNLERIADLANNIAEDVIYMEQGKEVRHHSAES